MKEDIMQKPITDQRLCLQAIIKDARDRSAIMECEVKFGAKILPVYSPLDIKVK